MSLQILPNGSPPVVLIELIYVGLCQAFHRMEDAKAIQIHRPTSTSLLVIDRTHMIYQPDFKAELIENLKSVMEPVVRQFAIRILYPEY